jgi:hypothetical protein
MTGFRDIFLLSREEVAVLVGHCCKPDGNGWPVVSEI